MSTAESRSRSLSRHTETGPYVNRLLRKAVPHLGNVPISRRLVHPESYSQALMEVRDIPKWRRFRNCLDNYTKHTGSFFFVQIGAHDGIVGDPIRSHVLKHGWEGLLVEPVPHLFEKLHTNYADRKGLRFDNVAVSDQNGTSTMLAGVDLPNGAYNPASSMSSLHDGIVKKHAWISSKFDDLVELIDVPTVTLPTLLETNGITQFDGLFVDTEGHDGVILDQLSNLAKLPQFILFEHTHLSEQENDHLRSSLADLGYGDITTMRRDTFARAT